MFQRPRRLLWGGPLAVALAFTANLAVTAAIPSAHRALATFVSGFDVDVIGADGRRMHGGTLLGTVRDEYLDS